MSAALLIQACGLSQQEAATFLNVRLDTVKSWGRIRNPNHAAPGILTALRTLNAAQRIYAAENIKLVHQMLAGHGAPDVIELGLSSDDHEAQSKGWPCVGAERMAYALVAAQIDIPCHLVPRGSTPGTAAAAEARFFFQKPKYTC